MRSVDVMCAEAAEYDALLGFAHKNKAAVQHTTRLGTKISTWTVAARRGAATLLLDVRRTPLTGQVVEKAILSLYVRPQCVRPSVRCCAVSKAEKGPRLSRNTLSAVTG